MNDSRKGPETIEVTLKHFSAAALRAAAEEFEEKSKRDPHLSLFRLHEGLLAASHSKDELEHLGRCEFCTVRREKLLPLVAEEELQQRVGADAATVFVGHGWIRNWLDRFTDKMQATIESLWEFVSVPLAEPSLAFAGEERERFYQRLFEPPIEIELVETESGHLAGVIKTDEPALENIKLRLVLESTQTRAEQVLQLRKGAVSPSPSAVVSFGDFEELASKLGLLNKPETGEAGFRIRVFLEASE